jgi:hypothetical protein
MRRLLRRKAVTITAAIVSFTAIPAAGIVATATPALASVIICNSSGNQLCIGAPTIGFGDPVELTATGRNITRADQFLTYNTFEVYELKFTADSTKCVGVQNANSKVTVRACSGGQSSNTYWARDVQPDGSIKWISTTKNGLLASDNGDFDQLFVAVACSGCYFRWTNF